MLTTPELARSIKGDSSTSLQHQQRITSLSSKADHGLGRQYQGAQQLQTTLLPLAGADTARLVFGADKRTNAQTACAMHACIVLPDTKCGTHKP